MTSAFDSTNIIDLAKGSFLAILIVIASSCATSNTASGPAVTNDDISDLRLIASDSLNAVNSVLDTLQVLRDMNGPCPPAVLARFTTNVHRLQVDSFKFRAHAQAMRSLGNSYFDEWQTHLGEARDPEIRKSATKHSQLLQQSFAKIAEASEQTCERFKSLISNAQILRRALESDLRTNTDNSTIELIQKIEENGHELQQDLKTIRKELELSSTYLTPTEAPPQPKK